MKTSEQINDIAEALSKAQGMMSGAKKGSNNPFFKSKYSDLASVIEAISEPFADNGLSFIQSPGYAEGRVSVTTRIMHSSGQWIQGVIELPVSKNDAQGYGSAVTYAKRYGLQGMAGVPSVDDDGNHAVQRKEQPTPVKKMLEASNKKMWDSAIEAYKRDGNFDTILKRVGITKENQDKIKEAASV